MKGIFIHNQLEYRLEVEGEEFHQGDSLSCVLSVKNHNSSCQSPGSLRLDLANGNLSKVKQKSEDAFEIVQSAQGANPGEIASGQQSSFSWVFPLDRNCAISDKAQSLFLIFGSAEASGPTSQLLVTVQAHQQFQQILGILQSMFQFVLKGEKYADGWVTAKCKPPTARRLSLVDELTLGFRFDGDALLMRYVFKVKKFETTSASVAVKKGKVELEQRFEPKEYLLTEQHVDHEAMKAKIEEALELVATGL